MSAKPKRPRPLTPAETRVIRAARHWLAAPWLYRIDLINAVERLEDEIAKAKKKPHSFRALVAMIEKIPVVPFVQPPRIAGREQQVCCCCINPGELLGVCEPCRNELDALHRKARARKKARKP